MHKLQITSDGIVDGYIKDEFGKRGGEFIKNKKPCYSLPIKWHNVPNGTKTLALVLLDYDAIPVCGFTWIHWLVANINPAMECLPADASRTGELLQGVTSWASPLLSEEWSLDKVDAIGYGGCAPPDTTHTYTIKLYALDTELDLSTGFYYNELIHAIQGHVLGVAKLNAKYKA